jgi:hypothetical protein
VLGPGGWSRPIGLRTLVETSEMLATCRDCRAWRSWQSCHLQSHPRRYWACMAPVFVRRGKTRDRVSRDTAMLNSSRALTCLAHVMVSDNLMHRTARQPLACPASANCPDVQPIVTAHGEKMARSLRQIFRLLFFFVCVT